MNTIVYDFFDFLMYKAEYLSNSMTDILGQVILYCKGYPVCVGC